MNANEINLMNYKLIYEHLADNAERMYSKHSNLEQYTDACQRRDKARHLYIRKMRAVLAAEQSVTNRDGLYALDLDFEIDPETYLMST